MVEFLHVNGQVMLVSDESQRHWVDPLGDPHLILVYDLQNQPFP